MRPRQLMLSIMALALPGTTVSGKDAPSPDSLRGWQELSLLKANEAQTAFGAALLSDPASREAWLGSALALLQLRSRTPANIATAASRLENLQRENPNDDAGIGAAYYLARIQQVHSYTPDRAAAIAGYRALLVAHPGHAYAQLAVSKLAILLLYDDVPAAEWERRVAEIEALIPPLTAAEAARDAHLTIAMAFIRLRHDQARAYPHFAACLAAGSVTRMPRLNTVLLQAAASAQETGRNAEAARYYADFLTSFPNDVKSDEIRRRVAALKPEAAR